tara:strand:+ start:637 stop:1032 length:396 start_codon:yes stop_codon:yes gene_type:complete
MTITQILNYSNETNTPIELQGAKSYLKKTASCISGEIWNEETRRMIKPASISAKHLRFPDMDIETQDLTYVGIQVRTRYSEQYYWFKCFEDINDPDAYWFFDHTYNRNNGQITKAKGMRVYKLMEKIQENY